MRLLNLLRACPRNHYSIKTLFMQRKLEKTQADNEDQRDANEARIVELCMYYPKHAQLIVDYVHGKVTKEQFDKEFVND
jgi:hypothetical protein